MSAGVVLALNAGSSSLKLAVYRREGEREVECFSETIKVADELHAERLTLALSRVRSVLGGEPAIVGHRLVHGGDATEPTVVDDGVMRRLEHAAELAPLHLPPALTLLRLARELLPHRPHVAVFDTAFHRDLPAVARQLPLPRRLTYSGLRRYGFHGLSCEYVLEELGAAVPSRLVIAHLGSGASITAVRDGRSVDTTMGLTPTGGIPMSSRAGDLDPGVILHLLRHTTSSVDEVEHLLNHESGLKGLAGSPDMVELLGRTDEDARLAVDLFCYAIAKQIGAYAIALGGLDGLVFTGGIGERAARVRELVVERLGVLEVELDVDLNRANATSIGTARSRAVIRIVRANEALMIARHSWRAVADRRA